MHRVRLATASLSSDEREFLVAGAAARPRRSSAPISTRAPSGREADAEHLRRRGDDELRERRKVEAALRESETRYRSLAARTNHLYALSASLSESLTLDSVAKAIVSRSRFVAGASAASVAFLNEDRTELAIAARRGIPGARRRGVAIVRRRPGPLLDRGADDRGSRCSSARSASGRRGSRLRRRSAPTAVSPRLPACRCSSTTRRSGVLMFHFVAPVSFDPEYRAVLVAVAHHSAQAIDRARLYESAQQARIDAEAANRSKDDFLSIVSHELRTPLTAVLGWASMLRKGSLDAPRMSRGDRRHLQQRRPPGRSSSTNCSTCRGWSAAAPCSSCAKSICATRCAASSKP